MESSKQSTEYESEVTDRPLGDETKIVLNGVEHTATVVEREAVVPSEEWPDVGETVTFKAVSGEVEKTVEGVDREREHPIQLDNGGWYERSNLVEYSVRERHKVFELANGREVWASS